MISMQQVQTLSEEVTSSLASFQSSSSESDRINALDKVVRLARALEKPRDAILKLGYSPTILMAVKIGVDMDIFNVLNNASSPVNLGDLAAAKWADPLLVERIMRLLCANGYAVESAPCEYLPTQLSREMTQRTSIAIIESLYLEFLPSIQKTPEFLQSIHYANPEDPMNAPLQYTLNKTINGFDWLSQNPAALTRFNNYMEGQRANRPHWGDWFPVRERILNEEFKPDQPLLVDIGGGRGHDIVHFKNRFPDVKGQYFLEELGSVLEDTKDADLDTDIQKLEYDFWTTPQPVLGARVYYFKCVFHDWSDDKARIILNHLIIAMERGYSKLVIEEYIVPDMDAPSVHGSLDLIVMIFCSGLERTQKRWAALLESVGLVATFWPRMGDGLGIIEAELPVLGQKSVL